MTQASIVAANCQCAGRESLVGREPSSARAKSSASNGRRSSSDSPTPISLTGMPSSRAIASAMPPLRGAVELRQHDAVDLGRLREQLRLAQAVLAGRRVDRQQRLVRRVRRAAWRSRGGPWSARPSGRPACAGARRCRRSRRRRPRARARTIASKATAPGSEPSGAGARSRTPARSAQPCELLGRPRRGRCRRRRAGRCLPSSLRRCQASLPIVVVLPVPLTPTTMITVGSRRRSMRVVAGARDVGQQLDQPLGSAPRRPRARRPRPPARAGRRPRRSCVAPTSAMISASSRRSHVSLVERPRTASPGSRAPSAWRVLACSRAGGGRSPRRPGSSSAGPRRADAPSPVMNRSLQSRAMRPGR